MKNTIRQYSLPGYELRDYTTEAIAFLRENEPDEGFFVGFSGGKDSIVSLELCRMAGVHDSVKNPCDAGRESGMHSSVVSRAGGYSRKIKGSFETIMDTRQPMITGKHI